MTVYDLVKEIENETIIGPLTEESEIRVEVCGTDLQIQRLDCREYDDDKILLITDANKEDFMTWNEKRYIIAIVLLVLYIIIDLLFIQTGQLA